jgi:hypothetical protein
MTKLQGELASTSEDNPGCETLKTVAKDNNLLDAQNSPATKCTAKQQTMSSYKMFTNKTSTVAAACKKTNNINLTYQSWKIFYRI